ncbi:hypothetical protein [Nocardia sp. NPDC049526]
MSDAVAGLRLWGAPLPSCSTGWAITIRAGIGGRINAAGALLHAEG